jgi:hypothetical protein
MPLSGIIVMWRTTDAPNGMRTRVVSVKERRQYAEQQGRRGSRPQLDPRSAPAACADLERRPRGGHRWSQSSLLITGQGRPCLCVVGPRSTSLVHPTKGIGLARRRGSASEVIRAGDLVRSAADEEYWRGAEPK